MSPRICPQCSHIFNPRLRPQIYCSQSCYWESKKKHAPIMCLNCATEFRPLTASALFCSYRCHVRYRRKPEVIAERFFSYVEKTETCWIWTGDISDGGYGVFTVAGKQPVRAHRWSWEHHMGPIPKGLCALHKCDIRICVNPFHLFLGTRTDNAEDRDKKGRTFKGEQLPNSKLTGNAVLEIRRLYASGRSQQSIADKFGVTQPTIGKVIRGINWKHIQQGVIPK